MKLESQVCSLELAKRLKELGVKQESLFNHVEMPWIVRGNETIETRVFIRLNDFSFDYSRAIEYWSAFTASELAKMLPVEIEATMLGYMIKKSDYYEYSYANISESFQDASMVNCIAKTLIHLIEQGYVKP